MDSSPSKLMPLPYPVLAILAAVVLATPFMTMQNDQVPLGVTLLLTGAVLAFWAMRRYPASRHASWVVSALILFSLSTLWISHLRYATGVSLAWLWSGTTLFLVCASWFSTGGPTRFLFWLVVATQTLLAGMGIWTTIDNGQRATGWLFNANGLGGVLLWGVLGMLCVVLAGWQRRWAWMILAFMVGAWALTISLTAYVAAVIPIGLALWWYRRRIRWIPVVAAVGLVALGAIYTWFFWRPPKLLSLMNSQHVSQSFAQRVEFDRVAIAMWSEKPLTGWGLGGYQHTFPRFTRQFDEQPLYAHNVYLQVLAETGIIGGLAWLAIVIFIGRAGWQQATMTRSNPTEQAWWRGLFLGWLAFSLHAVVDFSWHFPAGQVVWVIVSALFITARSTTSVQRPAGQMAVAAIFSALFFATAGAVLMTVKATTTGLMAAARDDEDAAIVAFQEAAGYTHSTSAETLLAGMLWLRRQGDDLPRGEHVLRVALRNNRDHYALHNALGRNLVAQQRLLEAIPEFATAYAFDPFFHPEFSFNYIMTLKNAGRREEATTVLRHVLQQYERPTNNPIVVRQLPSFQALERELLPGGI